MKNTATLLILLATAATARAQYPPPYQGGYPAQAPAQGGYPGQYPGQSYPPGAGVGVPGGLRPPLSPYLNLLRGGDPAVNYYYGVRPGLAGAASPYGAVTGGPALGFNQLRNGFLPAGANPTQEPTLLPPAGQEIPSLPSSAHPVSYGGLNRYSPGAAPRTGVLGNRPPTNSARPGTRR